jgi:hypothetical protein
MGTGPRLSNTQLNGEVIPCRYDYDFQSVFGNAFEKPVMENVNGDKYQLLRITHRGKKFSFQPQQIQRKVRRWPGQPLLLNPVGTVAYRINKRNDAN